ncbi:diguanylate cyclase domain-containing protein [Hydrogenophaga sp. OTU3427]|uniref:diguanylate cyclase domain-containing protein n=1 Tax=Hydrogenophaga sp. OTU3427 TaxID=3043856 RepID=UPI00313EA1DB
MTGVAFDFLAGLPRQPRLLVVDDQAIQIQVLYRALSPDCQVLMATSGEAALRLCHERLPDLVLLDVEMPDMDGFELLRQLKADPVTREVPVIFVTGHTSDDVESRCLEAGGVDYISKPINPRVVRSRVKTHLMLKFQSDLLRDMVFVDPLTNSYNRRYFDQRLAVEWARARRSGKPLSMLMIDVDHFKAYNDHYGHPAGDEALRNVVRAITRHLQRPGDTVARYGGEEFACLLPETDHAAALTLAERLEQRVREQALPHAQSSVAPIITISVGVSTHRTPFDGNAQALVDAADGALYEAKREGRGRARGDAELASVRG